MRKLLPRLTIAAAALACAGASQALVLTFDGLAPTPNAPTMPLFGDGDEFYEQGFWFDPFSNATTAQAGDLVGAIVDGSDLVNTCLSVVCPTNNTTKFYASVNDGVLAFGPVSNTLFRLSGLRASFVGASGDVFPSVTLLLRAQGVRADNSTLTETVQLPGPVNGAFSFASYSFSAGFAATGFQFVYLYGLACNSSGSCSAFTTNDGQFAIDDINVTAVPEPGTALSMALGLAALAAGAARRRTARR